MLTMLAPEDWDRLQEIFEAANALTGEERERFLDESCAGSAERRAQVEALLAALHTATRGERIVGASVVSALDAHLPEPGDLVGSYQITGIIGRGGMGVVYRAVRADGSYRKEVAIKMASSGVLAPDQQERFLRERQFMAALDHPNIARLLDGGATPDGLPYVVMEFVDGRPLNRYCDENKLNLRQKIDLMLPVMRAVIYAHGRLVIHRDLKPENILVTVSGEPKLLDFGIAKALRPDEHGLDLSQTMDAARLLTPAYASPEQIQGGAITTATDVYQLGALLYHLLTGRRLFELPSGRGADLERAICDLEPAPPGLNPDLDRILLHCLEKEPGRRYSSVEALAADIERYQSGFPVLARGSSWRYRTRKLILRHRWASAGIASALLLIIGFSVAMAIVTARSRREARTAEEVTGFLVDVFSANDPAQGRGDKITARELLDKGAAQLDTRLTEEPEVKARLYYVTGTLYNSLYANPQSEAALRKGLALQQSLHPGLDLSTVKTMRGLADTLTNESKYPEAGDLLRRALPYEERYKDKNPDDLAFTYESLAVIDYETGNYSECEQLLLRGLAILVPRHGSLDQDVLRLKGDLSSAYFDEGKFREATDLQRQVLEARQQVLGKNAPDVSDAWYNLAQDLTQLGQYEEALQANEQAVAVAAAAFGESNPRTIGNLPGLASNQLRRNQVSKALETARRAYDFHQRQGTLETNAGSRAQFSLGEALLAAGNTEQAIAMLEASLENRKRVVGPKASAVADSEQYLGEAYLAIGETAKAEAMERASLELQESAHGKNHEASAETQVLLAKVLERTGRLPEATDLLEKALATERSVFPDGHPVLGSAELFLGQIKLRSGQTAASLPLLQDAVTQLRRSFGDPSPQTASARVWLAGALAAAGKRSEAEQNLAGQAETLAASKDPRWQEERKLAQLAQRQGAMTLLTHVESSQQVPGR